MIKPPTVHSDALTEQKQYFERKISLQDDKFKEIMNKFE